MLNEVDALKIWQSIDESLEEGYILSAMDELRAHQAEMKVLDDVQHFLKEQNILPVEGEPVVEVSNQELYKHFILWRQEHGYGSKPAIQPSFFGTKMRTYNIQKRIGRVAGKEKTLYTINAASPLTQSQQAIESGKLIFMKQD